MKKTMKKNLFTLLFACSVPFFLVSCGGGNTDSSGESEKQKVTIGKSTAKKEKKEETTTGKIENQLAEKGIGPIKSLTLENLNQAMADEGKVIFEKNCTACHKIDKKFVGPALKGIMERRSPEWTMNMILNPEEMIQKDPLAKQVMIESNMAVMANQNLTEDEARKILEYFRTL